MRPSLHSAAAFPRTDSVAPTHKIPPFPSSPRSAAAFPLDAVAVDVDERLRQLDAQEEDRRRLQALRSRKGTAATAPLTPAPDGGAGGDALATPAPVMGARGDAVASAGIGAQFSPSSGHQGLRDSEVGPSALASVPVPSLGLSSDSPPALAASGSSHALLGGGGGGGKGGVCFPPLPPLHQRPQRPLEGSQ